MHPVLLILAAGMGSRYGGLKQVDRFGPAGETILEYSIYDALRAGFKDIVVVIRKEFLNDFREDILKRASTKANITFFYQELTNIPIGFKVPEGRTKPWGTGHAVLSAKNAVHTPFSVINADDFYGAESYRIMHDFLYQMQHKGIEEYCLVDYLLKHTLSESGTVSRGVCSVDGNGYLTGITEHKNIVKNGDHIISDTDRGQFLFSGNERVSMNLMGFMPSFMKFLDKQFKDFLSVNGSETKSEFFLPSALNEAIHTNFARVKAISTVEKWFGVTYREDREQVIKSIRELVMSGKYPPDLWA